MPSTLGVVGAGTMGAGIAQLGCGAGMRTLLHDPVPEALERGAERVRAGLSKWAERGRSVDEGLLELAGSLEDLAPCQVVIEAAPERFDLKRELFERLSAICPEAVLATNTSSIPVTGLASAAVRPENVVGMHFFNPAALMPLVEVIAADRTGERALAVARATGEAMEKRVILARDGPGFLVNRSGRPFYTEALRLLQERVATHEQIDRICRMGGGFRMGPFELMDLVGIDVGFEVAKSFMELSFGEPRWKPNPIQARMVAAGRLGRKSGRGYYDYSREPYRPEDPIPPAPGGGGGRRVRILGEGELPRALRERATAAGFQLSEQDAEILVDAAPWTSPPQAETAAAPTAIRLSAPWGPERWSSPADIGFHLLPPLDQVRLVELTRGPEAPAGRVQAAEDFFRAIGFLPEWVAAAPGLVLGRIVCQLVNEAAFAIGEGVGSSEDVNAGLELGLSHPRGPVAWSEQIGLDHVFAVIEGLYNERHEERYRCAPMLRRCALLGIPLGEAT